MRMLDGRSHRQICEMFGRVQRDPFWVKNIMSPSKLCEKWDELVIRLGRSPVQRCVNHTVSYTHLDVYKRQEVNINDMLFAQSR